MSKKKVRSNFRESCLKRDSYQCRKCGAKNCKLDVHHITPRKALPAGGYVLANGITLCDIPNGCHYKAELYYSAGQCPAGFEPSALYDLIGSSLAIATQAASEA